MQNKNPKHRKASGSTRINRAVQSRMFRYISANIPLSFTHGIDSKIVSDSVSLWLDLMELYAMPDFVRKHDGKTPSEVLVEIIAERENEE